MAQAQGSTGVSIGLGDTFDDLFRNGGLPGGSVAVVAGSPISLADLVLANMAAERPTLYFGQDSRLSAAEEMFHSANTPETSVRFVSLVGENETPSGDRDGIRVARGANEVTTQVANAVAEIDNDRHSVIVDPINAFEHLTADSSLEHPMTKVISGLKQHLGEEGLAAVHMVTDGDELFPASDGHRDVLTAADAVFRVIHDNDASRGRVRDTLVIDRMPYSSTFRGEEGERVPKLNREGYDIAVSNSRNIKN